jgi:hypothetical protein
MLSWFWMECKNRRSNDMRKSLIGLSAMLLVVGSIGTAGALTLTDTTEFTPNGTIAAEDYVSHGYGDVNKLNGFFDHVTWNHLFTTDGIGVINSAALELQFTDDDDRSFWKKEFAFGFGEDGTWDFGEIDTGSEFYDIGVNSLYDGTYQVTVVSLWGDFYIDKSILTIDYDPVPTPEPATMLLMGLGLTGIIAAHRRKAKKA